MAHNFSISFNCCLARVLFLCMPTWLAYKAGANDQSIQYLQLIYIEGTWSLKGFVAMQASASAVQRAGVNKSFTGMGSRAGSTAKLPISRTASGSVLDKRQEHDTGMITRKHSAQC